MDTPKAFHPVKRRATPIPVAPPRIPTPMPINNNNGPSRSTSRTDQHQESGMTKGRPGSGTDGIQLIAKTSKLDNDVKTAWINPRFISKIDMEMIKRTDYVPPYDRNINMNDHRHHIHPSANIVSTHNFHQKQQHTSSSSSSCGRNHDRPATEWENPVNGRMGIMPAKPVTASTAAAEQQSSGIARRRVRPAALKKPPMDTLPQVVLSANTRNNPTTPNKNNPVPMYQKSRLPQHTKTIASQKVSSRGVTLQAQHCQQRSIKNVVTSSSQQENSGVILQAKQEMLSKNNLSAACYLANVTGVTAGSVTGSVRDSVASVYGVYAETKYVYTVNGLAGSGVVNSRHHHAQASAAAAFFARAAQKLNLSASPHRRKRYNSDEAESSGFCGALQKWPPPVPPALLRRIGVREVTGVGKVKVMLRVSSPAPTSSLESGTSKNSFFSLDKRKKQVTLVDPTLCNGSAAPEDRRVGVAAPKMFAFDAIFSQDDSQSEVCSSALTDVIHAVINGTDGCLFCFGHAGLGKSYTMLGSPESANSLGIIPCAISWLFKGINEQKQKTGARFSVRVSAVEVCGPTNQLRDLLAGYSNDSEQSPGMYLREDPLFGVGHAPPHCELRVPTAEKAAHYLDAAVEGRQPPSKNGQDDARDSHLLFTLHVYQYSVAGKGGVAGGRSRLHLIDLGNSERGKASGGIPLSGVGNILLAIFNGQKHLPYKEHKLTHLLKDCLGSLTCHAAMIVHVSPHAQNYAETLTTVQLASRIHRMRRRRIKFVSTAAGNGSGGSSGEEPTRTTGTSSEPDPSSSDLSADTVIYVGRAADDATDGEHPPVYIPSLNSGDNRCSMSKALRGSSAEQRPIKPPIKLEDKPTSHRPAKTCQSNKTSPAHNSSPKSSPSRIPSIKTKIDPTKHPANGASDEQWIDGPRISKSKVAEARHLMKEPCHVKKRETWIDGPMQSADAQPQGYGYMDSHKKNMIRKWVEHQTSQIVKSKYSHPKDSKHASKDPPKELTQFKCTDEEFKSEVVKPLNSKKDNIVEESVIRTGLKLASVKTDSIPECQTPLDECRKDEEELEEDEEEPQIPPALPLIQPLSSREVSLESLDMLLKERMLSNAEYNSYQNSIYEEQLCENEDEILEIIEVEEPLEPVPMQDCCLQVTEEDIALCMGFSENPLPEVDQENPLDHPLRILSQENLTVVSTFTDSMSVYTDMERILPRHRYERYGFYNDDYEDPDNPYVKNGNFDENTRRKFDQLARLHELYTNRLAKANVANSETYQQQRQNQKVLTRCESLSLTDMLYGSRDNGHDNSSIYSEPAYVQEKFCENCKVNMSRPMTLEDHTFLSASTQDLTGRNETAIRGRFQRYCHKYNKDNNLAFLRHPDGASNPNLQEETNRLPDSTEKQRSPSLVESITTQPVPPPNSLPSVERMNRAILSLETGVTAVKLAQKSEGYDSGHDSTPRTSKHSPAAISRRAESGYDSVVRDSESSSIDSEPPTRFSNLQGRRGKCKHKHEKSFCSWFLNPFTCKYIDEPPETHF